MLQNMTNELLLPKTLFGCAPHSEAKLTTEQGKLFTRITSFISTESSRE